MTTTPAEIRRRIRQGEIAPFTPTSGMAMGYLQGNLVIVPADYAAEFRTFCENNVKPCPLLAVSERGSPSLPTLGRDLDVRTDLTGYVVWRHGKLVDEVSDISRLWRADLVTFILGCSFSFEAALVRDGIELRHLTEDKCVPMYRTNLTLVPVGPFRGTMVVSMRPMVPHDAIRAVEITSQFPVAHGSPVHFGDPAQIGISDLNRPDYGDMVTVRSHEVPVFWACGVTPQDVLLEARPEIAITHKPGCMLISDLPSRSSALEIPAGPGEAGSA